MIIKEDHKLVHWGSWFRLPCESLRIRFIGSVLPAVFLMGLMLVLALTGFLRASYQSAVTQRITSVLGRQREKIRQLLVADQRESLSGLLRDLAKDHDLAVIELRDSQGRTHAGYSGRNLEIDEDAADVVHNLTLEDKEGKLSDWQIILRVKRDFFNRFVDLFMILQIVLILLMFVALFVTTFVSFNRIVYQPLMRLHESLVTMTPGHLPSTVDNDSADEFGRVFSLYKGFEVQWNENVR